MEHIFERTQRLVGENALQKLKNAKVAIFGLGGVGGAALEALARGAVGTIALFDGATVSLSNRKRKFLFAKWALKTLATLRKSAIL